MKRIHKCPNEGHPIPMRRVLFILLVSVLSILPLSAADWSSTVKLVESSLVFIQVGDRGGCSGNVINTEKKYVLTAAHCKDKEMWVDRVKGTVIALDVQKDLMVLKVEDLDPTRTALTLAGKNPGVGEEVLANGYGYALVRPLVRFSRISDNEMQIPEGGIGGPMCATDATFVGGMSGSAVVNHKGQIVMMVQRGSNSVGIGVCADTIRERMGRFFITSPAPEPAK